MVRASQPLYFEKALVTAEKFVAAVAGERHLDMPRCELGDQIGGNRRGIAERFIEMPD
jgi:hypothetical protein